MTMKDEPIQWVGTMDIVLALTVVVRGYKTQKAAAKALAVSPQYLNDVLSGRRDVGEKLAKQFGVRPVRIFVPLEPWELPEAGVPI